MTIHYTRRNNNNSSEQPILSSTLSSIDCTHNHLRRRRLPIFRSVSTITSDRKPNVIPEAPAVGTTARTSDSFPLLLEVVSHARPQLMMNRRRMMMMTLTMAVILLVMVVQPVQSWSIPSINQSRTTAAPRSSTAITTSRRLGTPSASSLSSSSMVHMNPSCSSSKESLLVVTPPLLSSSCDDMWTMKLSSVSSLQQRIPPFSPTQLQLQQRQEQTQRPRRRRRGSLGFDVFELNFSRNRQDHFTKHQGSLDSTKQFNGDDDDDEEEEEYYNYDGVNENQNRDTFLSSSSSTSPFPHPGVDTFRDDDVNEKDFFPTPDIITWSNLPLSTPSNSLNVNRNVRGSSGTLSSTTTTTAAATSTAAMASSSSFVLQQQQQQAVSLVLPAWFPWIPTKAQIQYLRVTELKEACSQRGLLKTGSKATLQDRLWQWTSQQQQQHRARLAGDSSSNWLDHQLAQNSNSNVVLPIPKNITPLSKGGATISTRSDAYKRAKDDDGSINNNNDINDVFAVTTSNKVIPCDTPNSLEEWTRNVDLEKLKNKRQEIHRQKRQGKQSPQTMRNTQQQVPTWDDPKEYLSRLTNAMKASPASPYASNKEVKELYQASKQADQLGERQLSIQLLESLLSITPHDARVYRRLARMYTEQGDVDIARATLQKGLRQLPNNPWLWHGLGQLELTHGQTKWGIQCYQRAIKADPTFAHPYHAWGIYEYSQGHIAAAMKILKRGVEYCPTNHRLHHALGDLYRGAKLLTDADRSYRRALQEGPPVSHGFAYSSLACVAYEQGDVDQARRWLYRSINVNNGRHAQGWLALAEMEEAEGNPQKALAVCQAAIIQYEKGLIESQQRFQRQRGNQHMIDDTTIDDTAPKRHPSNTTSEKLVVAVDVPTNAEEFKNNLLKSIPPYRPGDKFVNVYRHWARLEERYGTYESANLAHERASLVFPTNYKVSLDWAKYHAKLGNEDRTRMLFVEACQKSSSKPHADPFRIFATFEMSHGNYLQARKVLFDGAKAVTNSADGGLENNYCLAQLYVTWSITEWHLKNVPRVKVLLDHALRMTQAGNDGSQLRSYIYYCMALLEYQEQGELYLAQHYIGLCLKENRFPGGNGPVWHLWAKVAADMGNDRLEDQCLEQAENCEVRHDSVPSTSHVTLKASDMEAWMRQDPWHDKLQAVRGGITDQRRSDMNDTTFYSLLRLPVREEGRVTTRSAEFGMSHSFKAYQRR